MAVSRRVGIILGLWFTSCIALHHSVVLADPNNVEVFPISAGGLYRRDARGTAVVYGCNAGNEVGPCVDTPALCTTQGGKFVGYCFFDGKYEGVCCTGLNPANATLTTKPPGPHDDSTALPTIPPAPTMTTQAPPSIPTAPTMTTQTMPPAPTMTTQTMPPAPTMTTQTLPPAPTETVPTAPAIPTAPTAPPPPSSPGLHDDTTPNPFPTMPTTQTMPPAPTMTTQTMPEAPTTPTMPAAPTTQTMPPAPTMTTQTMPPPPTTQTMPPAPTMTTQTMPPAPTITTDTMPPAPTMTTQTMPPPPTTQTMPPAPTMTTQTMPPAPTITTETMPPAPTMTTQTMPPAPTMTTQTMPPPPTTQTMPPAPTMTTQTLPPAPTMPTATTPAPPSSPGLHDDTTPNPFPTMPTTQTMPPAPTMTTQTMPEAPTTPTMPPPPTTQTMPPAPTMTTQTMPPPPTTQTMPPAPTMTTQTMPPAPTITTDTMPPAPTMTTQTMPPPPTTQTMPPAPTMTTQTMPPAPTITTETMPPAPTMTTQTMPPAPTMTTQTMPPPPTTQTMPPAPTMTTQTMPPAPTMTTQTLPPAPTMPTATTPAPPSTNIVFNSSNPWPTFPSMTTQSPMFNFSMTTQPWNFTTQAFNFTTQHMNFTTQQFNFTTQSWNFTTQSFNFTTQSFNFTTESMPNMTMTTLQMPSFPTTSTTTEATTTAATEASTAATTGTSEAPPPAFDVPGGCGPVVTDIESLFQNPSYPSLDTEPNVYEYTVMPQDGYCALRIEFLEALLAGKGYEGCSTDSVVIVNSGDTPTTPVCGLLQGYEFTTRTLPEQPVKIVVTTQSSAYLWSINVTQIQCNDIKPYADYESPDCGIKNAKPVLPGLTILPEEPKVVPASKLLKSKRKGLRDIMPVPQGPNKLLQSAALNRETSIKIVRGNETGINEYPWQALLMINGRPVCGASVLSEDFIITAGHCVSLNLRYPLVSVMTVDLGDHDLRTTKETKSTVLRISKIIPNIQNEGLRNDIALIKLAQKIPFGKNVRPVCLPPPRSPPSTYAGETGITTGWGRTEDSVISPVLREASVPILTNEKCRQQWASVGEGGGSLIESTNICVGGGDVGPCNGDSGGPLVVQEEDKWSLVGLTSFGSLRGCGLPGVPSVYTRITSYVDWIALNLAAA